jgi:imidazolonepropionase-like amidohydrolase
VPPGGAVERNADRYLFYGFTHVMSLGLDGPAMDAYLANQKAGRTTGARVLFAGFGFSQKGGWQAQNPNLHRPDTPDEARVMVRQEIARNVDGIKFWFDDDHGKLPKLPADVYSAIVDEAHKNGRKVFCHEFRLDDSKELLRHGLDVLAHSIRDREVDDEFLQLARQRDVTYIPTLVGHASVYTFAERPAFLDDPGLPMLYSGALLSTLSSKENQEKVAADPRVPVVKQEVTIAEKNVAKVAAAGVNIAIGTDAGPGTVLFGLADHVEMESLVRAGMTPMQVIKAATINGARVLGLDKNYGTLQVGKAADFVVLTADPLANIANTRKIDSVWVGGKPVDRTALAKGTATP